MSLVVSVNQNIKLTIIIRIRRSPLRSKITTYELSRGKSQRTVKITPPTTNPTVESPSTGTNSYRHTTLQNRPRVSFDRVIITFWSNGPHNPSTPQTPLLSPPSILLNNFAGTGIFVRVIRRPESSPSSFNLCSYHRRVEILHSFSLFLPLWI